MIRKKLKLYFVIAFFVLGAMFSHIMIVQIACTNCAIIPGYICIVGVLPVLLIGFVIFFFLLKTKLSRFINSKNVIIFSIIIAVLIIALSISFYFDTVPPREVTNNWRCKKGQDIRNEISGISIIYDDTYGTRTGDFLDGDGYSMNNSDFIWDYNEISKELDIKERSHINFYKVKQDGWRLTLRLDIKLANNSYYRMTTYYVSDTNFTFFNATLFDDATFFGSNLFDRQGR